MAEQRAEEMPQGAKASRPTAGSDEAALARLGNLRLRAAVELGSAELSVGRIAALGPGCVVRLDRLAGDPADLTVNGRLFARGEVVVIEGRLGLRLTELAGPEGAPPPST